MLVNPVMAGWFGPGPFNNGAPFAGYLNGRYMGVVTGSNISGVLGFAIVDGAPPFRQIAGGGAQQQQSQGATAGQFQDRQPAAIRPDILQNYFAIFVEGRVYSGITLAGIDIDSNTVSGALQGENPAALPNFTVQSPIEQQQVSVSVVGTNVTVTTNTAPIVNLALDALPIVNRGLSGGFTATINSKKATFTYSGTGQLSTPANQQTVTMSAYGQTNNPLVPPLLIPPNILTNEVVTGSVQTESTPFNIRGIRTSFAAVNQAATVDALQQQQGQQQ
jgi:hypothetical protein